MIKLRYRDGALALIVAVYLCALVSDKFPKYSGWMLGLAILMVLAYVALAAFREKKNED